MGITFYVGIRYHGGSFLDLVWYESTCINVVRALRVQILARWVFEVDVTRGFVGFSVALDLTPFKVWDPMLPKGGECSLPKYSRQLTKTLHWTPME